MRRLPISQDYLLKCLLFVFLFGFISLGAIGGCNNGSQNNTQVLTENDFASDTNLSADPERGIVVTFLEADSATVQARETGDSGSDIVPYTYTETINHTFCFEDDNPDSDHFMILKDSSGNSVLRADANLGCESAIIGPGKYDLIITHGGHTDESDALFLIPTVEEDELTNNVTTLLNTNICQGCDLKGANLANADLKDALLGPFIVSIGTSTKIFNTDLTGADLVNTDLKGATLNNAILSSADMETINLKYANLSDATLMDANLTKADLTGADLSGADITGATLTDADFSLATWTDGSSCELLSIGGCNAFSGNPSPCDSLTQSGDIIKCVLPTTDNSLDLVDVAHQLAVSTTLTFNMNEDTPLAILAWGGEGGRGSDGLFTTGGKGGAGGFASTVTTVLDFDQSFGQTSLFYYIGEAGTLSNDCGFGGASTLVMHVEKCPSCSLGDVLLIAGGGGGATPGGTFKNGDNGGAGGTAPTNQKSVTAIGEGQGTSGGAQGGSAAGDGLGGSGGTSDANGKNGIGGEGGHSVNSVGNTQWLNGDPGVGSNGQGGNSDKNLSGCAGGGGGNGGGGGASTDFFAGSNPGAGGGSFSTAATASCVIAPDVGSIPPSPGTIRDRIFGNRNGAVEVWIFTGGC